MNRYPVWKYVVMAVALVIATLYTLPNFFGEAPAVQVSAARTSTQINLGTVTAIEGALQAANLKPEAVQFEANSVKARFASTDQQIKARDAIEHALNPNAQAPGYVVALNLVPRTPAWLQSLNAAPMYLGLDLRGGVHFMLQVDMNEAVLKSSTAWPPMCAPRCATSAFATVACAAVVRP